MQTVYLLKDCASSYRALKMLYSSPDLSTNIIIVGSEQAQILLLDKRVKKFPFIINSLPTQIGLIPKSSQVMPLSVFFMLKDFHENTTNFESENEIRLPRVKKHIPSQDTQYIPRRIKQHPNKEFYRKRPRKQDILQPGRIRTKRSSDGGVNIFLNK